MGAEGRAGVWWGVWGRGGGRVGGWDGVGWGRMGVLGRDGGRVGELRVGWGKVGVAYPKVLLCCLFRMAHFVYKLEGLPAWWRASLESILEPLALHCCARSMRKPKGRKGKGDLTAAACAKCVESRPTPHEGAPFVLHQACVKGLLYACSVQGAGGPLGLGCVS